MTTRTVLAGAAAAAMLAASVTATAHEGATGIVKERMDLMSAIGDSTKAMRDMFSGEKPYDADAVRQNARAIAERSGERITELFPEGSTDHTSDALPAIWQDWDEFAALADDLAVTAEGLALAAGNTGAAADTGGDMGALMGGGTTAQPQTAEEIGALPASEAFSMMGDVCSACHTKFRAEDE
jgi:cytochrome c556